MATWIDLSAHNLALWRVGIDKDGNRRYVLLPIFTGVRHAVPDPEGPIGKAFPWDSAMGGYVLNLRYEQEKLPSRDLWLAQFPGALFRDRDVTTFPIHQPVVSRGLPELRTLPIAHPWVWSNQENPERFYANEEQALADGVGGSVLRAAEEVDSRGVRELVFPVESSAIENADLTLSFEQADEALSGGEEPANIATLEANLGIAPQSGLAEGQNVAVVPTPLDGESETSRERRLDYGEYIPNARKSAWEGVQADLDAQMRLLETTGRYDPKAIQILANKVRRDAVWGTLQERLAQPNVAGSPLKRTLWTWLYQETPASVKSTYWSGKKKNGIPDENLYLRVVAYPEVLRSIERKMDFLDESLSAPEIAEQFTRLLSGDPSQGKPEGVDHFSDLYPAGPYDRLPDVLRDRALFIFPVSMNAYADLLDHPSYSVFNVLGALKKVNSSQLRREAIRFLVDQGLPFPDADVNDVLIQHLESAFLTIQPDAVNARVNRDRLAVDRYLREGKGAYLYGCGMRMVEDALGKEATESLKTGSAEQMEQVLESYAEARRDTLAAEFVRASMQPTSVIKRLTDLVDNAVADLDTFSTDAEYRESKQVDIALANQACAVVRRQLIVADNLCAMAEEAKRNAEDHLASETSDATSEIEAPEDQPASSGDESMPEPQFIRWQPGLKPLPPERSDVEGYRTGPQTPRGDQDVTEAMLCERFGLRGIQYGNWMTQKDRQEHLNAAFDGLYDIQRLMGMEDPRAISLPRRQDGDAQRQSLALALGARGRGGRFSAHYEPSLHVINMTKTKGAGALLHEWTHAADWFTGAELTGGSTIAASHLSGNPVYDHVTTLKRGAGDEEGRAELMKRVAESAREKIVPMLSKTLISKGIQEWVCSDLKNYFARRETLPLQTRYDAETTAIKSGKLKEDGRTVSKSDLKQTRRRGQQEGVRVFEETLPKLVAAVDKLLARLDAAMAPQEGKRPLFATEMSAISQKILVEPIYRWKNARSLSFDEQSANNWFRELMDLPLFENEEERKRFHEKVRDGDPAVSVDEIVVKSWSSVVVADFWKNMARKVVNYNPYSAVARDLQGNSAFLSDAMTLDGKKVVEDPYWSAPHELLARSVSSIGYDCLLDDGVENTYLTDAAPRRYSSSGYRADPEPQGDERKRFAAEFFGQVAPYLRERAQEAAEERFMEAMPNEAASASTLAPADKAERSAEMARAFMSELSA